MNIIHVVILSVVEGITEFLPISSTGHLILVSKLLSIPSTDFVKTFEIAIQLGAILSVVVLYFRKILSSANLIKSLLVAFLPSVLVGFLFYPFIKGFLLGSSEITLLALFAGGIILIFLEKFLRSKEADKNEIEKITLKQSIFIGIAQSFSVIPGVSRAAATIIGGRFAGLTRSAATEFSFLLAIPTMFAATVLDVYKSWGGLKEAEMSTLLLGMILSFVFAMIAVRFLIGFVKKNDFTLFGVYRIILAVLFWIFVM